MNATAETTLPMEKMKGIRSTKKKILLADDDTAIRHILVRLLSEENYVVVPAANGEEALELAEATRFDLALLDLNMPVMDGWQTFEHLAAKHPALPVIVITARPNQLFSALSAGVGALLEKPLDFTKLFQAIRSLLAEPIEEKLARLTGRSASFHYCSSIPWH